MIFAEKISIATDDFCVFMLFIYLCKIYPKKLKINFAQWKRNSLCQQIIVPPYQPRYTNIEKNTAANEEKLYTLRSKFSFFVAQKRKNMDIVWEFENLISQEKLNTKTTEIYAFREKLFSL